MTCVRSRSDQNEGAASNHFRRALRAANKTQRSKEGTTKSHETTRKYAARFVRVVSCEFVVSGFVRHAEPY
jgi:hypothetical protein